jgi:mannose-6-phosphate isomerase-like protein (cupin superfamily)
MKTSAQDPLHSYHWGNGGKAWELLKDASLSVKLETIEPGEGEQKHVHRQAQQYFFVMSGKALIGLEAETIALEKEEGLHIPPGVVHRIYNPFHDPVKFLVISQPDTATDRINIK